MEWFQLGIFAANAPAITAFTNGIGVNVGGGIIDDSNKIWDYIWRQIESK